MNDVLLFNEMVKMSEGRKTTNKQNTKFQVTAIFYNLNQVSSLS